MATLSTTIKLVSTTISSDESLNLTSTDSLTVAAPITGISRVASENSGGSPVTLIPVSLAGNKYFYLKHTALQSDGTTTSTGDCIVSISSNDVIRLAPGEATFFPVKANLSITVQSNTAHTILCEYGYWTKG